MAEPLGSLTSFASPKQLLRLVKPGFAFRQVGSGRGSGRDYALSCAFWTRHRLLAANDNVVRPLVEDGVARVGANDEVMCGRWIEIKLGEARRADCETADVVADNPTEGAAV